MIKKISLFALVILLAACGQQKKPEKQSTAMEADVKIELLWATDTLLRTPESVIYDEEREFIYVSNVNENPWEKDGNGFISRIDKEGHIVDLFWVGGLDGPKGMAIVDEMLYVADIDALIIINMVTGEIAQRIEIEGAVNLNDVTCDARGKVYLSDSGGGKVYGYIDGKVDEVVSALEGRPNGLRVLNDQLLILNSTTSDLIKFGLTDAQQNEVTKGLGHGDGVMETNVEGSYVLSDWQGQLFHFSEKGGLVNLQDSREEGVNSADLWFIKETSMMVVPTFFDNRVLAYRLIE